MMGFGIVKGCEQRTAPRAAGAAEKMSTAWLLRRPPLFAPKIPPTEQVLAPSSGGSQVRLPLQEMEAGGPWSDACLL